MRETIGGDTLERAASQREIGGKRAPGAVAREMVGAIIVDLVRRQFGNEHEARLADLGG